MDQPAVEVAITRRKLQSYQSQYIFAHSADEFGENETALDNSDQVKKKNPNTARALILNPILLNQRADLDGGRWLGNIAHRFVRNDSHVIRAIEHIECDQ